MHPSTPLSNTGSGPGTAPVTKTVTLDKVNFWTPVSLTGLGFDGVDTVEVLHTNGPFHRLAVDNLVGCFPQAPAVTDTCGVDI